MKTIVITKVYEVRKSSKGWSGTECMWFSKEEALDHAKRLNEIYSTSERKVNFRVYEHTCGDVIICNE